MNTLRFIANPDTNYVFHMLSVARVGYDNAYGARFRNDYPAEDLAVLKGYEELLTVRGGEHCGALYHMMVSLPTCAEQSAKEYYTDLLDEAINGPVPPEAEVYRPIVADICRVMLRHYDDYIARIWPGQEADIRRYIPQVEARFASSDFTARAVELVGCGLPGETFTATMVTSVENGAEAIDISKEQDVFGIVRNPVDAFYFIGHEFIIYLLKTALKDEYAFRAFETWPITEGLAEYYLKRILGDTRFFTAQAKIVAFLEQQPDLPAVELYRLACRQFIL
jgi:hypothetical protein